jgi:hypothetical protein
VCTPSFVDRTAPVVADREIEINAPRDVVWQLHADVNAWPSWQTDISDATLERPLGPGVEFHWTTGGMTIGSRVYSVHAGSDILWGGTTDGITAIHEWSFTDTPRGVRVATSESLSGASVEADAAGVQALLEQSLTSWLEHMKAAAETR